MVVSLIKTCGLPQGRGIPRKNLGAEECDLTHNITNNSLTFLQGEKFDAVFIINNHISCRFSNNRKFDAKSLSFQNMGFDFLIAGSAIVQSQLLDVQPRTGGLRLCGVPALLVCELI